MDCRHFFTLEASQESLKRPKKAPKRHPKSSKTPKKRDPKMDRKINKFWTNFEALLGPIFDPLFTSKREAAICHFVFLFFLKQFFSIFDPIKSQFLNPIWTKLFASFFQEWAKMSPRGPSGASKSLFKNLKKHCVFSGFWVQRPPKTASRDPRRLPRSTKKKPKHQQKRCLKYQSPVKNALARRSHF